MKGELREETELKEMLINNQTWLHLENARVWAESNGKTMYFDILHGEICGSYVTRHADVFLQAVFSEHKLTEIKAFDWHNNPFTFSSSGKFALGKLQNLYPALSCPTADDRFFFVGGIVSAHHGWIVGQRPYGRFPLFARFRTLREVRAYGG